MMFLLVAGGRDRALSSVDDEASSAVEIDASLERYAADPRSQASALRKLVRGAVGQLPPALILAAADLQLRRGRLRSAESFLTEVLKQNPGDPWDCWARVGLGWIRVRAGDHDAARDYFAKAGDAPGERGRFATLMLGLLDGAEGNRESALRALRTLTGSAAPISEVRDAARLATGYVHYWSHHFSEAVAAFDESKSDLATSLLRDDASYAAALARYQAGEVDVAYEQLDSLADESHDGPGNRAPSLVELGPRAMLKGTFSTYRSSNAPLRPPESRAAELMNLNGPVLARLALRRLERGAPIDKPVVLAAAANAAANERSSIVSRRGADVGAHRSTGQSDDSSTANGISTEERTETRPAWLFALAGLGVLLVVSWLRRR